MTVEQRERADAVGEEEVGALAGRLFMAGVAGFELITIHLGVELGLYRALAEHGPLTPAQLAAVTAIDERYATEWLEQQATAELLRVEDAPIAADRRYWLSGAGRAVLVDGDALTYVAPMGAFVVSLAGATPALLAAYRDGSGVAFADYGPLLRHAQAAFNRPGYQQLLTSTWIPAGLPDVDARLRRPPAGRIADIGCGAGWSTIALAAGYPLAVVDGFDVDRASIEEARVHASAAGVTDRVRFSTDDVGAGAATRGYDLITMFEALHDMSRPVEVLTAARAMLAPRGCVLVADERAAEAFGAFGDPVERFLYAASVLHCLPVGRAEQPSAATGTVLRTETMRRYASEAGFSTVEVLPIDHDFFRFYRLEP